MIALLTLYFELLTYENIKIVISLVIQWLRLCTSNAGGMGLWQKKNKKLVSLSLFNTLSRFSSSRLNVLLFISSTSLLLFMQFHRR